jgi:hypothetical protein
MVPTGYAIAHPPVTIGPRHARGYARTSMASAHPHVVVLAGPKALEQVHG